MKYFSVNNLLPEHHIFYFFDLQWKHRFFCDSVIDTYIPEETIQAVLVM